MVITYLLKTLKCGWKCIIKLKVSSVACIMFAKIPEMSLTGSKNSSQSATGSLNPSLQAKQGTGQQSKLGTGQQDSVGQEDLSESTQENGDKNISKHTKSAHASKSDSGKASGTKPKASYKEVIPMPSSIVEELDINVNRPLSGAIIPARRLSVTSIGRAASPEVGSSVTSKVTAIKADQIQAPRRFSVTSLPAVEEQQQTRGPSKATSAVAANERITDQYMRRMSITSTHSGDWRMSYSKPAGSTNLADLRRTSITSIHSGEPRLVAGSPKSLTEIGQDRDSSQQRRRPSRGRRASLVLVGSNFRVGRKIGAGNFGEIRIGRNLATDDVVAIKLEPIATRFSQLRREYVFYKMLGQPPVEGIPSVYFWSTCLSYNALVMELLGPNLAELFDLCNQKFTLKTVVLIALQTIRRIQFVHSKSIVYRDIKPENFVIGRLENKRQVIYLLDLGLAKEYIDPETHEHIPYKDNKGITGTARYISINMHQGKEMSRRDDLEALGYMYLYFLKGRLPWQGQHLGNDMDSLNAVSSIKIRTSIEQLCRGHPGEFAVYLTYVRGLGFFDSPDYDFLSNIFISLLEKLHMPCDWNFDWMNEELYMTPSGMLVTTLTDNNRLDLEGSFVDRQSSAEGVVKFQSNKAMMSYDNLLMRDLSINVSTNKEAIFEHGPYTGTFDARRDKTGFSIQIPLPNLPNLPTTCILCYCCGVCCFHKRTASTNRISPI